MRERSQRRVSGEYLQVVMRELEDYGNKAIDIISLTTRKVH